MPKFEFSIEQTVRRRRLATVEAATEDEALALAERGHGEIREWATVLPEQVDSTRVEFIIEDA